ncbi:NrfD/PsrC family molybdoenzyme membrane anchor subunit [Phaeacidiphilus oryzae]|uniref:NrfD/PsrC family molybdoenzyme membrane anchor subunit n=1 Tax=Phaeacidiphilus oryzae TaxID=348818 RepID=UPI0007C70C81|nr:NrfD/PsrC family molybdoenzyme membrane anchor subunit [Phaeacidiphilus oryzae]
MGRKRRRAGKGEELMVEKAEFTSYYGRPVIKAPSWSARDIAGYFFLGGLAGAGSMLAAGAEATGRQGLARTMRASSLLAISGSTAALIHDLGRPRRFLNMLRVAKPTSPMSMGSWLLTGYGTVAGIGAGLDVVGRLPRVRAAATHASALLGAGVATYTAVLAADTAVPAWHGARRELPALFAASAACAASGAALLAAPPGQTGPARRLALIGCAAELVAERAMLRGLEDPVDETYQQGKAGRLMHAASLLSVAGAAAAPFAGRRWVAAPAGAALLAGSLCTRLGVFHAGIASAEDPKYTVLPQRRRLDAAAAERKAQEEREQKEKREGREGREERPQPAT